MPEIETEKATHDVPAPASGLLHHTLPVGTKLKEQMIIGYVLAEGEKASDNERLRFDGETAFDPSLTIPSERVREGEDEGLANKQTAVAAASASGWIKASPIARRLASERGISLTSLRGSGPGGRIVEADVLAEANRAPTVTPAGECR